MIKLQVFVLSALSLSLPAMGQQLPNLPQVFLNTTYPPLTGSSIPVNAGGDLQAALDSAKLGDEIVLQAGATYTGNFTLSAKTGSGWIVIRSSALSTMPSGTRVSPSNLPNMATVTTPNSNPVFANITTQTEAVRAAAYYRFSGLEITSSAPQTWNLLSIDDAYSLDSAGMPHDITVDRCYVHGSPSQSMDRGFWMGGASIAIVDSYFTEFHDPNYETQALYSENGPGPFKVTNNYLEAAGENFMFGGPQPLPVGVIPSDLQFQYNYVTKPTSWLGGSYLIKNLFESKNGQRLLIDSNVFENCWPASQTGMAVVLIPRSGPNNSPWAVDQDITFTNNVVRNVAGGINVSGSDDQCTVVACAVSHRVLVQNNLFYGITTLTNGPGYVLETANIHEFTLDHNTTQTIYTNNGFTPWSQFVAAYPTVNETISNNIFDQDVGGQGTLGPSAFFNSPATGSGNSGNYLANNLLVGPGYDGYLTQPGVGNQWDPLAVSTFYAVSAANVGYKNYAANNFALGNSSPYKGKGTDGKDLGYNPVSIHLQQWISGRPAKK